MKIQQFRRGDLVFIKKITNPAKRHFKSNCYAIIIGSYKDRYGGTNIDSYFVLLDGKDPCSWYHESDLCLIKRAEPDPINVMKEYLKTMKYMKKL